jgi:hypothetical protein
MLRTTHTWVPPLHKYLITPCCDIPGDNSVYLLVQQPWLWSQSTSPSLFPFSLTVLTCPGNTLYIFSLPQYCTLIFLTTVSFLSTPKGLLSPFPFS